MTNKGWYKRGNCFQRRDLLEAFFPPDAVGAAERGRLDDLARSTCAGCPVKTECQDYALANFWMQGTWGGWTEEDRLEIRRRRSR